MIARIRTFIGISLITLLVWVLAEGASIKSQPASAEVRLDAGSATMVLRVLPTEQFTGRVEMRLSGTASALENLTESLRPIPLKLGDQIPAERGEQLVDLRAALRASAVFQGSGVSLLDVSPRFVRIEVDELERVDVPVHVQLPDVQTEGLVRAVPETVKVEIPRAVRESISPDAMYVVVQPSATDIEKLTPGTEQRIEGVKCIPSPELGASWSLRVLPQQASVVLTLRSRTASEVLPTVPVQIRVAPSELARFDIQVEENDQFLHDVAIRGPGPLIDRIRADTSLRPVAVVALSFEELERGIGSKEAVFVFPPGFEQVEARADSGTVRLKITRKPTEPAPE